MQYKITYRQKDKGWQYIINRKEGERWKYVCSKQGFKTKSLAKISAELKLDELKEKHEIELQTPVEYKGITFKEFTKIILKHKAIYNGYGYIKNMEYALNYCKSLNDTPILEISSLDIQQCVDTMVGKIKPSTVGQYVRMIKSVFKSAMKPYNIIKENPVQDIVIPKEKAKSKVKALSKKELDKLLGNITNPKYYLASLIAAKCGLRIGEVLGLTWDRIDFKNNMLTVDRQWKILKDGQYGFGEVKSKNSNREIPMSTDLVAKLKNYKASYPVHISGRVLPYKSVVSTSQALSNYYTKLGFADTTAHHLRHTFATMLIGNGLDFKTVADLMGQDVKETMRTYSHVTSDMKDKAKSVINAIF